MALYSPILSGKIRGSIGNTTFRKQRGRYGAVAYERIDGYKPDPLTTIVSPVKGAWMFVAHAMAAISRLAVLGGYKKSVGTSANAMFGAFVRSFAGIWDARVPGYGVVVSEARKDIAANFNDSTVPFVRVLDQMLASGADLSFRISSGSSSLAFITHGGTIDAPSVTVTAPYNDGVDVAIDVVDVATGNVKTVTGKTGASIALTDAVTAVSDVKTELYQSKLAILFVRVGRKRVGATLADALLQWKTA